MGDFDFHAVANKFRLIDNNLTKSIIVPYGAAIDIVEDIVRNGIKADTLRKIQPYTVNLYKKDFKALMNERLIEEFEEGLYRLSEKGEYDDFFGLKIPTFLS